MWHRHTLDRDSTGSRPIKGVHMTGYTQPLGERECKKLFRPEFDRWSTEKPPSSTGHRQPLGEREIKNDFRLVFDRISTGTRPVTTSHWEKESVKKCAPPALDRGSTDTRPSDLIPRPVTHSYWEREKMTSAIATGDQPAEVIRSTGL